MENCRVSWQRVLNQKMQNVDFQLREGVEFHNEDLDANDVIATMDYHRSEDSKSAKRTAF